MATRILRVCGCAEAESDGLALLERRAERGTWDSGYSSKTSKTVAMIATAGCRRMPVAEEPEDPGTPLLVVLPEL